MSLTELSLSHSYQSKLSKTGSSLDFPSLLFPAHAQYTLCTCSVKGFPSLLCLHMLSSSTQMHNFQGESSPAAKRCIIYRTTVVLQQKTAHPPWKTVHPPICDGKYHCYDSDEDYDSVTHRDTDSLSWHTRLFALQQCTSMTIINARAQVFLAAELHHRVHIPA